MLGRGIVGWLRDFWWCRFLPVVRDQWLKRQPQSALRLAYLGVYPFRWFLYFGALDPLLFWFGLVCLVVFFLIFTVWANWLALILQEAVDRVVFFSDWTLRWHFLGWRAVEYLWRFFPYWSLGLLGLRLLGLVVKEPLCFTLWFYLFPGTLFFIFARCYTHLLWLPFDGRSSFIVNWSLFSQNYAAYCPNFRCGSYEFSQGDGWRWQPFVGGIFLRLITWVVQFVVWLLGKHPSLARLQSQQPWFTAVGSLYVFRFTGRSYRQEAWAQLVTVGVQ